ncbi:MAG: Zn-ribbon domain-containing OB-fold protein [Thaumarchaeota archaeon]|nr:Zn-ribbon domain-containing OB-fold protein [Nitrososphaerota archaeon]
MSRFGVKEGGEARKPLPYITNYSQGFWEGTKAGELRIQKCNACSHKQWIPKAACEECGSIDLSWIKSGGKGKVYSYSIIRHVVMNSMAFEKEIPYALALIDLDDGVRVVGQVVECKPEDVKIGMEVEAFFEDIGGASIFKFRPRR